MQCGHADFKMSSQAKDDTTTRTNSEEKAQMTQAFAEEDTEYDEVKEVTCSNKKLDDVCAEYPRVTPTSG